MDSDEGQHLGKKPALACSEKDMSNIREKRRILGLKHGGKVNTFTNLLACPTKNAKRQ
jgi:hypothetical protein